MSVEKVKIKDLPSKDSVLKTDIFVESDTTDTYKVTAEDIATFVIDSDVLKNAYVDKSTVGTKGGIVPLNSDGKIEGSYIQYGTTSSTAYEGSAGKILETNLDNHLTDEDAHGFNSKLNTLKGSANGLAELDENGKVPSMQLPSFVDDVLEGNATGVTQDETTGAITATGFILSGELIECTPESGKIYIDIDTNIQYRWSGTIYITTGSNIALGETSSTAYRGDRGKIAYDHSQSSHAPSNAQENVIETIQVNGVPLTQSSKSVDIAIPTKVSDLENDKGFVNTNTTYSLSKSGDSTIVLTGSDGSETSATIEISSGSSVSFTQNLVSGTKVGTLTIDGIDTDLFAPTNTDTHYTTGLKVGASNIATTNEESTNGSVYLNVLDDNIVRDSHKIIGSGATTVTSDVNGVITISSKDTSDCVKEQISSTEPTDQNVGDHWLLEF